VKKRAGGKKKRRSVKGGEKEKLQRRGWGGETTGRLITRGYQRLREAFFFFVSSKRKGRERMPEGMFKKKNGGKTGRVEGLREAWWTALNHPRWAMRNKTHGYKALG